MRLILVRRGDTHAGLRGMIAGRTGCHGLTDLGRRQTELVMDHPHTERLGVDVDVTSELPRAIETAGMVAPALGKPLGPSRLRPL